MIIPDMPIAQQKRCPPRGRLACAILLLAFWPARAPAETDPPATPAQIARLDAIMAPLDRQDAPGCAVAAMRAGTIVYERGTGMADLERNVRITPRTKFFIASSSKQFTAFSVALLASEGKLSLDDDVRRYVPELPDFGHRVTIRHLLWHISGLREESNLLTMAGWRSSDLQTEEDILRLLSRQKALNFKPGEEFLYSNTGYTLLSIIVKRVSGSAFGDFAADRIFRPLGMADSEILDDPARVVRDRAIGYWGTENGKFRIARVPYAFSGPTGVVTTVADLARWESNFYDKIVGSAGAHAMMYSPGRLTDGTKLGYAMGVYLGTYRGLRTIGHGGSDPGFKADVVRFPDQRLSVAVLCNSFDIAPTPIVHQIADVFLEAAPAAKKAGTAVSADAAMPLPAGAASLAGNYWNRDIAQAATFLFEDGKLLVDGGSEGKFALRHIGGNRFLLPVAPRRYVFTFLNGRKGERSVRSEIEGEAAREFVAVPASKETTPAARYAGVYYSPELDVEWNIIARDGKLIVDRTRFGEEPLAPLLPHVFQLNGGFFTLEFDPPKNGPAASFEVTTERARHMRFVRRPGQGTALRP